MYELVCFAYKSFQIECPYAPEIPNWECSLHLIQSQHYQSHWQDTCFQGRKRKLEGESFETTDEVAALEYYQMMKDGKKRRGDVEEEDGEG